MKKLLFLALASTAFAFTACSDRKEAAATTAASPAATSPAPTVKAGAGVATALYSCPMHPGEVSDHPGKCAKCGMTLVKKP